MLALWPWLIHSSIGWSKLFLKWCLLEVLKATFLCVCKFFYCFYTWVTVCLGKTCFESNFLSLRSFLIDAFELWCCGRLLRVPWTAGRSNQSILKEISPEYSLEGLMLKLKLQYFGHLMWRADSFEKTLMLWKIEGRRRRGDRGWDGWMGSPTQWTWLWVNSGSWRWRWRPGVLQSVGLQRVRHDWVTELNWADVFFRFCSNDFHLRMLLCRGWRPCQNYFHV